jgi:hypothetical protein
MSIRKNSIRRWWGVCVAVAALLPGMALAAVTPVFDSGVEVGETPYEQAQVIENIYRNIAVYGKLGTASPVDIYRFVPNEDGKFDLALHGVYQNPSVADTLEANQVPFLILLDPTGAIEGQPLNIPLPSEEYKTVLIKEADAGRVANEPLLMQQYRVLREQLGLPLKKDATYYLVVFDPERYLTHYVIKTGEGTSWGAKDLVTKAGSWLRVKTDNYGDSRPFTFSGRDLSLTLFLLSLATLVGTWLISVILGFLANRSKAAGYLLIKLQPYARLLVWFSLWFLALGGYSYFNRTGWTGLPFLLLLLFLILVILFLYQTLRVSPRLMELEVSKREATIPTPMRKRLFLLFVLTLLSLGAFLTFTSMYLANPV